MQAASHHFRVGKRNFARLCRHCNRQQGATVSRQNTMHNTQEALPPSLDWQTHVTGVGSTRPREARNQERQMQVAADSQSFVEDVTKQKMKPDSSPTQNLEVELSNMPAALEKAEAQPPPLL
uniref:Uncharacterized protein n=1 Tax=Branchiostoma floridae TaxID=7739 RepID=C3YJD9_BRAFL|eukprot:XP_002603527.1 hypothetical protein BRAFLDRAFT_79062 [Branchiostoma floridae]